MLPTAASLATIEHMSNIDQAVALIATLAALDTDGTDPELIDEITALEQLKTAISARQARITDAFAVSQRATLIQTVNRSTPAAPCAPRSRWPAGTAQCPGPIAQGRRKHAQDYEVRLQH